VYSKFPSAFSSSEHLSSASPPSPPVVDPGLFTNRLDEKLPVVYEYTRTTVVLRFKTLLQYPEYGVEYAIDVAIRGKLSDQVLKRDLETVEIVFRPGGSRAAGTAVDTKCGMKGVETLRTVDGNVFPFPLRMQHQAMFMLSPGGSVS
jgi:hypothetical protein